MHQSRINNRYFSTLLTSGLYFEKSMEKFDRYFRSLKKPQQSPCSWSRLGQQNKKEAEPSLSWIYRSESNNFDSSPGLLCSWTDVNKLFVIKTQFREKRDLSKLWPRGQTEDFVNLVIEDQTKQIVTHKYELRPYWVLLFNVD